MSNTEAESATFAINLKDGTTATAETAANALGKLRSAIDADSRALGAMQRAMKNLQGGAVVNVKQFRELQAQIAAKKAAIAQAQSSFLALGGTFGRTAPAARGLAARIAELSSAAQATGGPVGSVVGKLGALRGVLAAGVIVGGILAIAAALAVLVVASVAAVAALAKYGIAQADARRSELLRIEGLTKMRNWYGLTAGNAADMQLAIDRVSGSVALGRDKVAQYSDQLYKMGLRGENLSAALEGVAIKATAQGDAAAGAFAGWAAGAAMSGQSVRKLANDVKARLGGIAAKQMLALDVQSQKLHESFNALFTGIRIEGLLKGLGSITSLLSQSTRSGQALKVITEIMLKPLIAGLEYLAPLAKRFFQGMIIGALLLTIALLKVRNYFRKAFGDSDILRGLDAQKTALNAGLFAVMALASAFVLLGSALALAFAPLALVGGAFYGVYLAVEKAYKFIRGIDWGDLGASISKGIVGGLLSGSPWVVDAIKGLGTVAWKAFRLTLGIASPSKVFARLGVALPQGVAAGVTAGAPAVNRSVRAMVALPNFGGAARGPTLPAQNAPQVPVVQPGAQAPQGAPRGAPGGQSNTVSIGELHVHTSAEKPAQIAADVKEELVRLLEGVAVSLGASMPVGGA